MIRALTPFLIDPAGWSGNWSPPPPNPNPAVSPASPLPQQTPTLA